MEHIENLFRQIPQVDKLMQHEYIINCGMYRHEVANAARDILNELRESIKVREISMVPDAGELANNAIHLAKERAKKGIRPVINGTGVILHSNLGRACLSKAAVEAVTNTAASYCTLEYDIEEGKRGSRTESIEKYLREITNCEASIIVNNNAAAVLLILFAIASNGNVIVSRGELVEIGGKFRVPDIIDRCGCYLLEVGTTNKTRTADYEVAIDENTKAMLKVHSSNFKIVGFTESAPIDELSTLGKKYNIPVIEDIGSGALVNVNKYGLYDEPLVKESLNKGADIVSFSGDKLLGGPQCGIIVGKKEYIAEMRKHPLYRALRADKMTIAALEATLRVYADTQVAEREIPVLSMLSQTEEMLRSGAEVLCKKIEELGGAAEVIKAKSVAGGGSVPGLELNSYAIAPIGKISVDEMEQKLRAMSVPIIGRIENNRYFLDMRTIFEDDYDYIANAVAEITQLMVK
ncbi:MAG: L-seryl-tRNA(Sec) selenium transferase [Oscillospiraceae bacterium]|nr:L-seryl-tRNA(Sec) selenium transferase [Oscillospiraceae bacterium]